MGSTTERVLGYLCPFFVKRGQFMKVNGKDYPLKNGQSLLAFLEEAGYEISRIVVERNLEIVPKASYADIELLDSDSLEIVHFVGGG